MKLAQAVETYLTRRQSCGAQLLVHGLLLRSFNCRMGDIELAEVRPSDVMSFINGKPIQPETRRRKHRFFEQFFEYWVARGQLKVVPLPPNIPKGPQTFTPHIYSRRELRRLLDATRLSQRARSCSVDAPTFRTMLLFLYGTGMRLGEALRLKCSDVDLKGGIITIRGTGPDESRRLMPIGWDVRELLRRYSLSQVRRKQPRTYFFLTKKSESVTTKAVDLSLRRALKHAEIYTGSERHDGIKYRPRIHDLRHTFAVHRLIVWYREGADILRRLPELSAFLGHVNILSVQWYLKLMTVELRKQTRYRFEANSVGVIMTQSDHSGSLYPVFPPRVFY